MDKLADFLKYSNLFFYYKTTYITDFFKSLNSSSAKISYNIFLSVFINRYDVLCIKIFNKDEFY